MPVPTPLRVLSWPEREAFHNKERPRMNRTAIYNMLEATGRQTRVGYLFNLLLITMVAVNLIALVLETVPSLQPRFNEIFWQIEVVTVLAFTLEYIIRTWAAVENPRFRHPLFGRLRYTMTPMAIIDFLAILPFWLAFLVGVDGRSMQILRIFRILRLAKLTRYSRTLRALGAALLEKRDELFITLFAMLILLMLAATAMYHAEHEAQPQAFSSIPAAMWWGIATLTTVGYGDIYPVTVLGRMIGSVIAVLGIGMFALPAGILGAAFLEQIQAQRKPTQRRCPHCIGLIDDNTGE